MKYLILLFITLFSISTTKTTFAQSGPHFKFKDKNNTYNFGKIKQGNPTKHVYQFTNTGNQPLVIMNVSTTCGCTTPEWTKRPIAPGKDGSITVSYDASKVGLVDKSIYIKSNANNVSKFKRVELRLKGEVVK